MSLNALCEAGGQRDFETLARPGPGKPGGQLRAAPSHGNPPRVAKTPGFRQRLDPSRRLGEGVEFLVVTRWESLGAIAGFAGADPEAAVVPAEVAEMMIEYDRRVRHFEVIE
jgi:heme-degrading monooxygenase HmoA